LIHPTVFLSFPKREAYFSPTADTSRQAQKTVTVCDCVEAVKPYEQIREYFNKIGAKRIAVEGSKLTVAQYERLKERLPEFEFFADKTLDLGLDGLRRVKTAKELEFIKAAQKTAEDAFQHILTVIKEGVTERELALELDFYMLKAGAEELSFKTIAVSGANSSMPHGVPSDKKTPKGRYDNP